MASITAAITGLKTAADITKTIMDIKTTTEIQGKVIELQGVILAAQSSALEAQSDQFTLLEEKRQLERQIADMEAWDAEKERYELTDVGSGTLAYTAKESMKGAGPKHYLCANCFENRQKSILQPETPGRTRVLCCNNCGADIYVVGSWYKEHKSRRR